VPAWDLYSSESRETHVVPGGASLSGLSHLPRNSAFLPDQNAQQEGNMAVGSRGHRAAAIQVSSSSIRHDAGGGKSNRVAAVHPVWDLMAGSAAGATAVMLTYPLDLVR
jgi:hypothetical protein